MPPSDRELIPVTIEDEMRVAYMDYAMSVIVSRALPDVRDGLKPVHRRILYTMDEENLTPDRAFRKSAATVGTVIARYHPHGDAPVYEALVRMAQDFNMRYPLVQGQGNFGSIDGDNPAHMRYTEARLSRIAMATLEDLDKDTVDWRPNFDSSRNEPCVLPTRLPNLLLNGSDGIAVGMATKIPPHNLSELVDGLEALLGNPELTNEELMDSYIPGPDFPTGAMILGKAGIRQAYTTGRGSITMRAIIEEEDRKRDRKALIVTEIPFQVNKSRLLERIAEAIKEKRIEGVSDLRDESDRRGMRIVFELSAGAVPEVVKNQLYKHSDLQSTFGVNMLALVNNTPKVLDLRTVLLEFLKHRREVVTRRTRFLLDKAQRRDHIVQGLLKALDHIDEIIALIRSSQTGEEARGKLTARFEFSEAQAQAILDMRLQRLTGLEREKLEEEHQNLLAEIAYYESLLADAVKLDGVVKDELLEIKTRFGDKRRTQIVPHFEGDLNIEDLIAQEEMVVTISHGNYIKRVPYTTYKAQKRGGRGVSGASLKEEDFIEHIFVTSTHHSLLFFTTKARVFKLKVHEIGEFSRTARGTNLVNLLNIAPDEKVAAVIPVRSFEQPGYIVTCSREGVVKRTALAGYQNIRRGAGLIALGLKEGDELVNARLTPGNEVLMVATENGMAIRFNEEDVRSTGRLAQGVRGIRLRQNDRVVAMDSGSEGCELLVVTRQGFGKRTPLEEYPLQNRGGKGVRTVNITAKTGPIAGARVVNHDDELMLSTSQGILIKVNIGEIRPTGRVAQGVIIIRLDEGDEVAAMARIPKEEEDAEAGTAESAQDEAQMGEEAEPAQDGASEVSGDSESVE
ncbi:MAG: DNA gyrase subunit A [Candidatus Eremiobacterota bacterium]